tara:strand:- start:27828 stop:28685 length:858 start_codon:yes stop_codon:yes gene_type:complete
MKKIGIIGNGFVGSAIAAGFVLHVDDIFIHDIDPTKSTHSLEDVLLNSDFVFLSVPTPMKDVLGGEIDTSILDNLMLDISNINTRDNVIIVKSTVVPGTMERYAEQFPGLNLVFNPEFLTERRARLDFINSSRIVLGGDNVNNSRVEILYRSRFSATPILKTDFASAQLIKYIANCFFAVKVSFMNEIRQLSDAVNADWDDVVNGLVLDGRVGNSHLDVPGHDGDLGFGGKCFPKDINAIIHKCKDVGVDPKILKAAWDKNLEVRKNHDWTSIEGAVSILGDNNE